MRRSAGAFGTPGAGEGRRRVRQQFVGGTSYLKKIGALRGIRCKLMLLYVLLLLDYCPRDMKQFVFRVVEGDPTPASHVSPVFVEERSLCA